ncbi:MAG: hypothetical protein KatS3mg031_2359 [Chitinophagales bacterium]|nr:MAG: hypothetical protein KatS3mg031_2359 [Chitinophagales bacterium]
MPPRHFYAHGKLLLSGEYLVLEGARALAIPTSMGQHLEIRPAGGRENLLYWETRDERDKLLMALTFETTDFRVLKKEGSLSHYLLQELLREARKRNPQFLAAPHPLKATAKLEFPLNWGLGSSSSLIWNIACWSATNPFELLFAVSDGSGYDIACAGASRPVVYQLSQGQPLWHEIDFNPPFAHQLFFVHLEKKQNSQQAVSSYRRLYKDTSLVTKISAITENMISCTSAAVFASLMEEHEDILAQLLHMEKVKTLLFPDFPGSVKSLGAWGGDFVMACSDMPVNQVIHYFKDKGFNTIISFEKMFFHRA